MADENLTQAEVLNPQDAEVFYQGAVTALAMVGLGAGYTEEV